MSTGRRIELSQDRTRALTILIRPEPDHIQRYVFFMQKEHFHLGMIIKIMIMLINFNIFSSQLESLEKQVLRTKLLVGVGILNDQNTFIFVLDEIIQKDQAIIIIINDKRNNSEI